MDIALYNIQDSGCYKVMGDTHKWGLTVMRMCEQRMLKLDCANLQSPESLPLTHAFYNPNEHSERER